MGIRTKFNPLGTVNKLRNAFVYTVGIPSDGYVQELPINNATYVNPVHVDWGDGSEETLTSGTYPTHTYTTSGDYQIKAMTATGQMPYFYFNGTESAKTTLKSVDFCDVTWFKGNSQVNNYGQMFSGCSNLTTISTGLFDNSPLATNFYSCFSSCAKLSTIPAGLFDHGSRVTMYASVFLNCISLTSIPSGLYDNSPLATDFSYSFYRCSNLETIPCALFANNIAAYKFYATFYECKKAVFPGDIFCCDTDKEIRFSSLVPDISACFWRGSWDGATSGTAPDLWNYTYAETPVITKCFGGYGNNDNSLSNYGDIPEEWRI